MNKRLYNIWACMKQRCNNPKHTAAFWYHDRGIRVCEEWNIYANFEKWALQNGYSDNLSIDRINPDGNYEPNNCSWITIEENRRLARKRMLQKSKLSKSTHKIGRFMVVMGAGEHGENPDVLVVRTGLSKSQSLKLCDTLKSKEPYSDSWFCCRVTDGRIKGEAIKWRNLRNCLKYQ